jgi:pSer/pThr/pTyr-binding forkhead associated (FHA) protein
MTEMARLSITLPDSPPAVHELTEINTIGRAPDNSIQLDEPSVSGRHAELMVAGESCYLKDLDSTNGTLVNNQPVSSVQLRSGDKIRFGKVEACFECDVAGGAQPLPQPEGTDVRPAELSARPADFANASPFPGRKKTKDPARLAVLAAVGVAVVAFLASVIALTLMRPPAL